MQVSADLHQLPRSSDRVNDCTFGFVQTNAGFVNPGSLKSSVC